MSSPTTSYMRPLAALVAMVAAMAALLIAYNASPARAALDSCTPIGDTTTCTFLPSGSEYTFVVPEGVSTVHVVAIGAPGAVGLAGGSAGSGAQVRGDLTVTHGQKLYVNVGGAPTAGSNCHDIACNGGFNGGGSGLIFGGGGGGASDVRTVSRDQSGSLDSRLIVAGGGGGSGEGASSCDDINGDPGPILEGGRGGDAGLDGGDGTSCRSLAGGTGGKAGTQSEGGAVGSPGGQSVERGGDGSLGLGGNSGGTGGGGGGGYYGGGGGGGRGRADTREASAGGGGGGSNLVPTGGTASVPFATTGPSVTISYATPHIEVDRTDDPDLSTTPSAGACTAAADNDCSLRGAITAANANAGDDTIDLPSGTYTLSSRLPTITSTVTVDGGSSNPTISGNDHVRVFEVNGNLTLNNLTVAHGSSGQGGGIKENGGTVTVNNSTISDNRSEAFGGGILNGGTLTVNNSTFSGNVAGRCGGCWPGTGGAIYNSAGTLTVNDSTFSGNSADFGGGGIRNSGGTATLKNTIVANSLSGGDCGGTDLTADSGYNLVEDGSCGVSEANNSLSGDPDLGPLQDNGGPTLTHGLLSGSPAIDAGPPTEGDPACPPPLTDQRGVSRPQGSACDIGAFELDTTPPSVKINQASGQADPTTDSTIHFTAVFDEPVSGFDGSDVTLSGTAGATTAVVTETAPNDGTTYDVAVSGMSSDGTVIASIPANAAQDAAQNGNTASTSTDSTVTFNLNGRM